tara:strand:- start:263 stop:424 length:162 start_codon:yes stop_codon:yes gene_type:complete
MAVDRTSLNLKILEYVANGARFYTKEIEGKTYVYMDYQDTTKFLGKVGEKNGE